MIYEFKIDCRHYLIEFFLQVISFKSRQERTGIINSLHEGMNCIPISLDTCNYDRTIVILKSLRCFDTLCSPFDSFIVDTSSIINLESDILYSITVTAIFFWEFFIARIQRWDKGEDYLSILNYMRAILSISSFKSLKEWSKQYRYLISNILKTEASSVKTRCLLCIANMEFNMIKS